MPDTKKKTEGEEEKYEAQPPPVGTIVYLSVYPTKGEDYGGEWDTDKRGAISAAGDWRADHDAFIVRAVVLDVVERLPPRPVLLTCKARLQERGVKIKFTDADAPTKSEKPKKKKKGKKKR